MREPSSVACYDEQDDLFYSETHIGTGIHLTQGKRGGNLG